MDRYLVKVLGVNSHICGDGKVVKRSKEDY